ncbi:hypothetical protein KAW44_04560 [Candidatus Bipolaricaulota bacterium]|nr:hypothetical protein [Candidatus Bipolaricaulota bacterium]
MPHEKLQEVLEVLANHSVDLTHRGLAEGTLPVFHDLRLRWVCSSFEYTETGVNAPLTGSTVNVRDWAQPFSFLAGLIKESKQWIEALTALESSFDTSFEAEHVLTTYVQKQILPLLGKKRFKRLSPKEAAECLVREIAGEPMEYRATARLDGLVLLSSPISFECGGTKIHLRQTTQQDIETEQPAFSISNRGGYPLPTAIMVVTLLGRGPNDVQDQLDRILAGLRLYRVCSACLLSVSIDSDAIMGFAGLGMLHTRGPKPTMVKGVIQESDIKHLVPFMKRALSLLPVAASRREDTDPRIIALHRYSDALFDNGVYDRRVLGSIMALEAVMLGSDEMQELGFKLSVRTARLLSYFGSNPGETQTCLKLAYRIRSKYVHGGLSSPKDKKKVIASFGNEMEFTREVFNIVRKILLIMILIPVAKEELIEILDSALIGEELGEFEKKLATAREYVID